MTNDDFDRLNVLCDKMVVAQQATGRDFTDAADLTPMERSEYHALTLRLENETEPDPMVLGGSLAACVGGEDDGRIGIQSDAAW